MGNAGTKGTWLSADCGDDWALIADFNSNEIVAVTLYTQAAFGHGGATSSVFIPQLWDPTNPGRDPRVGGTFDFMTLPSTFAPQTFYCSGGIGKVWFKLDCAAGFANIIITCAPTLIGRHTWEMEDTNLPFCGNRMLSGWGRSSND